MTMGLNLLRPITTSWCLDVAVEYYLTPFELLWTTVWFIKDNSCSASLPMFLLDLLNHYGYCSPYCEPLEDYTKIQLTFDERHFYSTSRILLCCMHLGHDWLSTRSAVAGATFINEFALYAMHALPLKRRIRQRFTEFLLYLL